MLTVTTPPTVICTLILPHMERGAVMHYISIIITFMIISMTTIMEMVRVSSTSM